MQKSISKEGAGNERLDVCWRGWKSQWLMVRERSEFRPVYITRFFGEQQDLSRGREGDQTPD
jgi:hypothetical protein